MVECQKFIHLKPCFIHRKFTASSLKEQKVIQYFFVNYSWNSQQVVKLLLFPSKDLCIKWLANGSGHNFLFTSSASILLPTKPFFTGVSGNWLMLSQLISVKSISIFLFFGINCLKVKVTDVYKHRYDSLNSYFTTSK